MVAVKGGGQTYQIGSGKAMPWEDVPAFFKEAIHEQIETPQCAEMGATTQQCIEDKGFWFKECVELMDRYHLCRANALRKELPALRQQE